MTRGTTSRNEIFCLYVVYIAIFKKKNKRTKKLGSQHRKSQMQAKNEKKYVTPPCV